MGGAKSLNAFGGGAGLVVVGDRRRHFLRAAHAIFRQGSSVLESASLYSDSYCATVSFQLHLCSAQARARAESTARDSADAVSRRTAASTSANESQAMTASREIHPA